MRSAGQRRFWTAAEDGLIREQYSQCSVWEIATTLGRSKDSVKHRARKLGISESAADAWTPGDIAYLRERYAIQTAPEIAAALGRTANAIHVRANIEGLRSRHRAGMHSLVPGYFKVIDTPMKAYLLGLLTADGYVSDRGQVCLALAEKDMELVELARDSIAPAARLKRYKIRGFPNVVFKVQNAELAADLAAHGVVPCKSFITKWPGGLPAEHEGSYLCGVSDGDGSLERKWIYHWALTSGCHDFLQEVRARIFAQTGVTAGSHPYPDRRKENTWKIAVTGMPVRALDAWMHRDVPGLARKRLPPEGQPELGITG
jgi:hypothetical protein